jgi:hypothetical protein
MVRRGSTVRVRQRALEKGSKCGPFLCSPGCTSSSVLRNGTGCGTTGRERMGFCRLTWQRAKHWGPAISGRVQKDCASRAASTLTTPPRRSRISTYCSVPETSPAETRLPAGRARPRSSPIPRFRLLGRNISRPARLQPKWQGVRGPSFEEYGSSRLQRRSGRLSHTCRRYIKRLWPLCVHVGSGARQVGVREVSVMQSDRGATPLRERHPGERHAVQRRSLKVGSGQLASGHRGEAKHRIVRRYLFEIGAVKASANKARSFKVRLAETSELKI